MKVDIAIITILPEEYKAISNRFNPVRYTDPSSQHEYGISQVQTQEGKVYTVAVARTSRQGNDVSQQLATWIINDLDPQLLLVVGIGGGVPDTDFTLGDVIVSSHIHNFDLNAIKGHQTTYDVTGGVHPIVSNIVANLYQLQLGAWNSETSIGMSRPRLQLSQEDVQRLLDEGVDKAWRERVEKVFLWHFGKEQHGNRAPNFLPGTIASSNSLIRDDAVLVQWLQVARSIRVVEMETAGVYQAAQQMRRQYPVMAIRGVSDIVGFRRSDDWKQYACHSAAAFAYAFISAEPAGIVPRREKKTQKITMGLGGRGPGGQKRIFGTMASFGIVGIAVLLILDLILRPHWPQNFSSLAETPFAVKACLDAQQQKRQDGLGVQLVNSDCIGISDGNAVFDLNRPENIVRQLVADAGDSRANPHSAVEQADWQQATKNDPTNAEAGIYYEDSRVQNDNGYPHATIIAVAVLSGKYGYDGPDVLQGVYLQQKEHNDACRNNNDKGCILLKVLVANIGSGVKDESDYATQVTDQIAVVIAHDPTIVGVMSGVTSQSTTTINNELSINLKKLVPVVASKATIDQLPQTHSLFRVVPPNSVEARTAADFAKNVLHVKRVAVLYRSDNLYGLNLEGDFSGDFPSSDKTYQLVGQPTGFDPNSRSSIENALKTVLQDGPDLLYCACYVLDVNTILQWLAHHDQKQYANLRILGGDSLYGLAGYTPDARSQWYRLYFTAFTYPDIWQILPHSSVPVPQGIGDYKNTYGADAGDGQYGSTRMTPSASVAYDAMFVLAQSCNDVFAQSGQVTALALRNAIAHQNLVGISGRISFGHSGDNEGNPDNKIIVVVQIVDQHFQYANFEEGTFV
ncbi:MAG TPA: hypothetical protein VFB60_07300 [Ktedonobacteraceae bacterium]|nr:hypothetical protein [Ktedonobacteraceae bacterium]